MTFEQDYNKLLTYAKACLKNNYSGTEYDLVNEAFIYFHDKPYTFTAAKTIIGKLSSNDPANALTSLVALEMNNRSLEHEKFCKCCNESKPIAAFFYNFENDRQMFRYSTYCKDCMNINRKKLRLQKAKEQGRAIVNRASFGVNAQPEKTCRTCGKQKSITEFRNRLADCKSCKKIAA